MKSFAIFAAAALLSLTSASAQWVSKTYTLANGWNGIWMAGDASHTTVADIFGSNPAVTEVWRWNPDPDEIEFTTSPSTPTVNSEEWTVWKRNDLNEQLLTKMVGNSSYLIRTTAATTVTIKQRVLPPAATWLISGANFLGFPSTTSPSMSAYLASYPSASTTVLASGAKIFKYVGGELSATNPRQVSTTSEIMNPNTAYWFQIPTISNFTAPVEYELPGSNGLAFGRTLNTMTAGVTNRSTAPLTLTVSVEASAAAPDNQTPVTGGVPLKYRKFNSDTNTYDEIPITGSFTVSLPASGRLNLDFIVNRGSMVNSSDFYASVIRIKDSANLTDVTLPVTAQASTPAGLWACQVKVTNVNNTAGLSGTSTSQPFPLTFLMHSDANGQVLLLGEAYVGRLTTAGTPMGISTNEKHVYAYGASDVEPHRYFCPQMPVGYIPTAYSAPVTDPPAPAHDNRIFIGNTVNQTITIDYNNAGNPFVHRYHPDHDNLPASFTPPYLSVNQESYTVVRNCGFTFTAAPPDGSSVSGWGTTVLGGTYTESLSGLNHVTLHVSGTFSMRRISEISDIDISIP